MDFIKKNAYLFLTVIVSSLIISCNSAPPTKETHTIVTGTVSMVVDETFQPIVEDQLAVFENTYLEADITLVNKPERLAVNYLMDDSVKIAILSRTLTSEEMQFFHSKKIIPKTTRFAIDGIALITGNTNQTSVVTVDDIINVLHGKPSVIGTLVFDNPNPPPTPPPHDWKTPWSPPYNYMPRNDRYKPLRFRLFRFGSPR